VLLRAFPERENDIKKLTSEIDIIVRRRDCIIRALGCEITIDCSTSALLSASEKIAELLGLSRRDVADALIRKLKEGNRNAYLRERLLRALASKD